MALRALQGIQGRGIRMKEYFIKYHYMYQTDVRSSASTQIVEAESAKKAVDQIRQDNYKYFAVEDIKLIGESV